MRITTTDCYETEIKHTVLGFYGGERHVQIDSSTGDPISKVTIHANVNSSNDLMDLLLIENALRYQFGPMLKINLELPYLPYSRQDRVCAPGQAFSLEVFANILKTLRLERVVTWDCHSQIGVEVTEVVNVTASEIIQADDKLLKLLQEKNSVRVCPDEGAVDRCNDI